MNLSEKSINQKILNYAKDIGASDVNKVRTTIALERLVARIQSSEKLQGKLAFCGGFVLYEEGITDRYTRDVDMVSAEIDHDKVIANVIEAIETDLKDGFWFGSTLVETIIDDVFYGGIRFRPYYKIGEPYPKKGMTESLRRIHLDLSFQSIEFEKLKKTKITQVINEYEDISWSVYPLELIAADKVHAILSRAGLSTRAKDLYDLYYILDNIDKEELHKNIFKVCTERDYELSKKVWVLFENIETDNLKRNWSKIDFKKGRIDFETCLTRVLQNLRIMDL